MQILTCARGTVSVFLILVFTALLVMVGVITDAARIMTAQNRVQGALDSALRSTLAGYHSGLVGEFGLYGTCIKPEITNRYFLANMREAQGNLHLIRYNISQGVTVEYNSGLLSNEEMRSQILHYMKYKGPLAAVENIFTRLCGDGLKEKTEMLTLGQEAVAAREQVFAEVAVLNRNIAGVRSLLAQSEQTTASGCDARELLREMEGISSSIDTILEPAINRYEDIAAELNSRTGQTESVAERAPPETAALRSALEELRLRVLNKIETLRHSEARMLQADELIALFDGIREISLPAPEPSVRKNSGADEAGRVREYLRQMLRLGQINPDDLVGTGLSPGGGGARQGERAAVLPEADERGSYRPNEDFMMEEGNKIISFLSSFGKAAEKQAAGMKNSLYLAGYILDKFTYITSSTARDRYFQKGEVEYILCGDNSELKNILNVSGQIFFIRFALNSLSSFLQSPVTEPYARMAYALTEGFFRAGVDLCDLYDGKRVPFFPDKTNDIAALTSGNGPHSIQDTSGAGYSDHLLILLLLQDEDTQFQRMRNLIQVNLRRMKDEPGFILGNLPTVCRAKVEVEINLWFAPILHLDKFGLERFKDGKFLLVCESTAGF